LTAAIKFIDKNELTHSQHIKLPPVADDCEDCRRNAYRQWRCRFLVIHCCFMVCILQ